LAFLEVHSETDSEKRRLERWKKQNADVLNYANEQQLQFWEEKDAGEWEEDVVPEEFLEAVKKLNRKEYRVEEIMAETFLDLDQIVNFLEETKKFDPKHDDKLSKKEDSNFFRQVLGRVFPNAKGFVHPAISGELDEISADLQR